MFYLVKKHNNFILSAGYLWKSKVKDKQLGGGGRTDFFHCFLLFACRKFYLMVVRNDLTVFTFLFIFHYLFCVQVCFQVTLKTSFWIQFRLNMYMPGRHCCVSGCSNGDNKLKKWKSGLCEVHSCHFGTARCTCGPPR